MKGKPENAFAIEIAKYVDSQKVQKFLKRGNAVELINFRGNKNMFYSLDVSDFTGYDDGSGFVSEAVLPINLKDKIVIMGFMGEDFGPSSDLTRDDKFHTPMNPNYAGKAYPDMFGVVIHANIVSMVLNDIPMSQMGTLGAVLLAIVLCYLNVVFFYFIHDYYPSWYDLVVKTMQVLEVFIILFVVVMVYGNYRYQLDVTIAAIAIGLSGDILEVYTGAMYNIVGRFINKIKTLFTGKQAKVRSPSTVNEE